MALSNLHTNWMYGSYINDRDDGVKVSENNPLRIDKITDLNAHVSGQSIDVGYGYDLFQNLSALKTELQAFVTPGSNLNMVYQLVDEYLNQGNPRHFARLQDLAVEINKYFDFGTEAQAAAFLTQKLNGFESTLDNILGYTMAESRERAALMSICYNKQSLLTDPDPSKSIANAVINDDRIRAWYLIRYRLNGGNASQGVANRRYRESDMFGLWGAGGPTSIELEKFETFLAQMDPYAPNISMLQYMRNYETLFTSKTPEADYTRTIDEQINNEPTVKSYFVNKYAPGATIDGNVIIGTELNNTVIPTTGNLTKQQVQNGFLKSTALNDLILGGTGNDTITGGEGNDILMGGANDDTYIVNTGDGTDTIEDKQGNNKVMLCGKPLKFFYDKGGYQYTTADGTITAEMQGTDLVVTHTASGTKVILNENFEWGDFGINLLDMPDAPTTTLLGDLTPTSDPPQYDSLGNVIVDPNTPSPDRSDYLYDSTTNDRIEGKGGNDILHAMRGGDDLLAGGEGNDIVLAGEGDDNVFSENEGEMDDLIEAGETAQSMNAKGDLASGGVGNDLIYGSNRKDALFGGEGLDLLVGGGGDDLIYGDSDFTTAQLDWSYTADSGLVNFTNVAFVPGTSQGDDAIYAGTGDDIVFGDGGIKGRIERRAD